MTEIFPPNSPPSVIEYGWERVAEDMPDWHPGLHAPSVNLLEKHGVVSASHEVIPTVNSALVESQHAFVKFSQDDFFRDRCEANGIDPDIDMDKEDYWDIFADAAHDAVEAKREKYGDSMELRCFEILADTPSFLYKQRSLDMMRQERALGLGGEYEIQTTLAIVSFFNDSIRSLAHDFPELHASSLEKSMAYVADKSIEDESIQRGSRARIHGVIRGAQHEMAFGQILSATGLYFDTTDGAEDLKGGDYIIDLETTRPIYIDVKASLKKIRELGSDRSYAIKRDRFNGDKVLVHSPISDIEFHDTFFVDNDLAKSKAVAINELLDEVRRSIR